MVTKNMRYMETESENLIGRYSEFAFLWKEDIETSFQAFLNSGEIPAYKMEKLKLMRLICRWLKRFSKVLL